MEREGGGTVGGKVRKRMRRNMDEGMLKVIKKTDAMEMLPICAPPKGG